MARTGNSCFPVHIIISRTLKTEKMNAEIISTGNELLLGHTINTNAALLALKLADFGFKLRRVTSVGDSWPDMENALRDSLGRSELIIITGGLGPTPDDLTREMVADVLQKKLVIDEKSLNKLKIWFSGKVMSENQKKQALLPEGSIILDNPAGTAMGAYIKWKNKNIILLPGPPNEIEAMLKTSLHPVFSSLSDGIFLTKVIRLFGISEGNAAEKISSLISLDNPMVATYAGNGEIQIKISAKAISLADAQKLIKPLQDNIYNKLGEFCYGEGEDSLAGRVNALLAEKEKTVATAESCTGGWLAQQLTAISGSSAIFHLGVVSYANAAKEKILEVPHEILEKYGAVSPETAICMANGIRELANSSLGISITGIAGPDGGSNEKPVGLVYLCLANGSDNFSVKINPQGIWPGREKVRYKAVLTALDMLRRYLENRKIPEEY